MSDAKPDATNEELPIPKRPRWGWMAWSATVGYIAQHHSPDATLKLEICPGTYIINWSASLTWGEINESVTERISLADALNGLWEEVERNHKIFDSLDAATRRPSNYDEDSWLDPKTYDAFSRLVSTTDTVFEGDWLVVIVYRPIEAANKRYQTRLVAENNAVNRGGNGPSLRDACRNVYHNTAPIYKAYQEKKLKGQG